MGDSHGALYHTRIINEQHREIAIAFPLNEATYRIGIVKEGVIGFDSCYTLCGKFILQCDFIVSEIL